MLAEYPEEVRRTALRPTGEDQAQLLVPGEEGQFWSLSAPGPGIAVRVGNEPPEPWDGSTVRVRLHAAPGATLPANGTGSVKFATRLRHDLVIREGAVLRSPEGPYVLVATNDRHTLTKRPVEVGSIMYGYASVISGLTEDEWVVALHAFELDTARAEVAFHKAEELREIGWTEPETFTFIDYRAAFHGEFHDIRRDPARAACLSPSSYAASQTLAATLLAAGSSGIVYPSVRQRRGTCLACFRPALVTNLKKGSTVTLRFPGPNRP